MNKFEPVIEVIEEEYEIPHLGATRKISILLPYNYYDTDKRYPVLYLQDGQNLFNPNAPYGDWAIDKSLSELASRGLGDLLVVAVDHGEHERISEYLPYDHPRFGKGKGSFYIKFMKENLIPYVNRKYRTLTDYSNTGIGGSSMGGLISLYAGLTEPDIFGKLMVFSPSLWMSKKIFFEAKAFRPRALSRIYLYAGGKESKNHLRNVKKLCSVLIGKIHDAFYFDLEISVNEEGEHAESFWREEFPQAITWLFFNKQR